MLQDYPSERESGGTAFLSLLCECVDKVQVSVDKPCEKVQQAVTMCSSAERGGGGSSGVDPSRVTITTRLL